MSLHANNSEAQAELLRQRRKSTIMSMVCSLLLCVVIMLALALFLLSPIEKDSPTIVSYTQEGVEDAPEVEKPKVRSRAKASAPSMAMAPVMVSQNVSQVSIPTPEVEVTMPTESFGTGDDMGIGLGMEWGDGGDFGEGGDTSFFGRKMKAKRVAYVIDYSASMGGERDRLMREELTKSVAKLDPRMEYQLLFFAGPVWVAGDTVAMNANKTAVVESKGHKFEWETNGGAHGWDPKGKKQQPEWMKASSSNVKKSLDHIEKTKLVWGTIWDHPIDMALSMEPPPSLVFFMTDGQAGKTEEIVKELSIKARKNKTIINTIAMMQPKAEKDLRDLAENTGGEFSIVLPGGKVKQDGDKKK